MKLPIRTLGLAVAALLLGSALAPVSAQQQQSGVDGQVAVRSDGALYLIINGQRRWVATVVASDEEINAIPEGEPLYSGLAPVGSSTSAVEATKPSAQASPSTTKPSSNSSSSNTAKPQSSEDDNDNDEDSDDAADDGRSSDIPLTVDLDGSTTIERGDDRTVEIQTRKDATCELRVDMPGDDDIEEDSKNADSRGRCKYTIEIPDDAKEGNATLIGTAREGGKFNRQEIGIKIVKKK
jgi:hypothetical protein